MLKGSDGNQTSNSFNWALSVLRSWLPPKFCSNNWIYSCNCVNSWVWELWSVPEGLRHCNNWACFSCSELMSSRSSPNSAWVSSKVPSFDYCEVTVEVKLVTLASSALNESKGIMRSRKSAKVLQSKVTSLSSNDSPFFLDFGNNPVNILSSHQLEICEMTF